MAIHIITVATHYEGKLKELINNKFNVSIKVLGFGKKWSNFKMKYELVNEYIKKLPNNDIIIFLDGFDSEIKLNPELAIDRFKKNNYKLLFSYEPGSNFIKLDRLIWPSCKNNSPGNSGLYMGYVKYLKVFLEKALIAKCKDDQVVMNDLCKYMDFIDIDTNKNIFQNLKISNGFNYNNKAIFISYPGQFSFNRIYRFFFEYIQFILLPLFILYLIILYFLLKLKKRKYICIFSLSFVILLILLKADYSCINYTFGFNRNNNK